MPKISTHLALALKLLEKTDIENRQDFMLGNAYADCWKNDIAKAMQLHYKIAQPDECNLKMFSGENACTDFNFGWYFHLWIDNRIKFADLKDISSTDCVIFDMPVIYPFIKSIEGKAFDGVKNQAVKNIFAFASEPMPLYIPDEEKRKRYDNILDDLVQQFLTYCKTFEEQ